ncbi:MAG TPA: Clp protease N-terminal domain-containing protein [Actinoplanes sp.]|nr:Clp protease N-terminal domain-containing protein [Actinoplanes sp.]
MPIEFAPDAHTAMALRFAAEAADQARTDVTTAHLLTGLIVAAQAVTRLLDVVDITPTVAAHVLRKTGDGPDGTAHPEDEPVLTEPIPLTDGAKSALAQAARLADGGECRPETLLCTVLADDGARAATMLRTCGADPQTILRAAGSGVLPDRNDPIHPDLRDVRDRMIGRERFKGSGLKAFLFQKLFKAPYPYAAAPSLWVSLESEQIARQRGTARRTDDLLIAMLATYEVARSFPHLTTENLAEYDGSRHLAEAGLDHRSLRTAATDLDLGDDEISIRTLISKDSWPKTTTELLTRLSRHENTRASRLLKALNVNA